VLVVLFMTGLLGMVALVVDAGSWFHSSRSAQATADAAALAGAQGLVVNTGQATALAIHYGSQNGGGVTGSAITFSSQLASNDTITVQVSRSAPSFFAKLLGFGSIGTPATASARVYVPSAALGVAPVTVNRNHPMLSCQPPPCSGATQIDLADLHSPGSGNAAGAFSLLNIDPTNQQGSVGANTVASWLTNGLNVLMPLGVYDSVPSAMFNNSQFKNAVQNNYGNDLLFPVYNPPVLQGGSNAQFNIIGWVGFHITSANFTGSSGTISGHFTTYIATGIQATTGGEPNFGAETIQLTK
jgi:hypothetical protein